ncbi:uncharacterized protein LOC102707956 [Oryza brachyantha]|uniref:uncharacterized protein LOC102707956 n=1 Tax=Oryza brachyantha TaxID=4533 RepID=UPI0007760AB6|nr:uncharacterized protein LOC102707956 [Oryza brachyantha]
MEKLLELPVIVIFISYFLLAAGRQEERYVKHGALVSKIIETEDGDVFHCIDMNQQPALSHPLLKGHRIQMEPTSYPSELKIKSSSETTTTEAHLPTIACPKGTIPLLQNSKVDLKTQFSFDPMGNTRSYGGERAGCTTYDEIYGTQVAINVYEPKVRGDNDFSASWALMVNGPKGNHEGIGAGSIVWRNYRGDNFARFHIYWQADSSNMPCFDHICPGFVQVSQSVGIGGRIQPVSVYNGLQFEIIVTISKDPKTGNWWLAYGHDKTPLGYWPSSIFSYMNENAKICFWGGQVHGPTVQLHLPEMGSGHWASVGPGKAAYVRSIKVINKDNQYITPGTHNTFSSSTREFCYDAGDIKFNDDGVHLLYGGPGNCTK